MQTERLSMSNMVKCWKCGEEIHSEAVWCRHCGESVDNEVSQIVSGGKVNKPKEFNNIDFSKITTNNSRLMNCPDCGKEISKTAPACPNCGKVFPNNTIQKRSIIESASVSEKAGVFSSGIVVSVFVFFIGLILSFTGILAIVGIPMMIVAVIMPFTAAGAKKANCPHCGSSVPILMSERAKTCPFCKKRLIIKDGLLEAV